MGISDTQKDKQTLPLLDRNDPVGRFGGNLIKLIDQKRLRSVIRHISNFAIHFIVIYLQHTFCPPA